MNNQPSSLATLCSLLGQIPVDREIDASFKLPPEWDSFTGSDWELLISQAQRDGLAPLLYWLLSKTGKFSSLPEELRNSLRLAYYSAWKHNQIILDELMLIARAFKEAGIPLVVLKGACFALTIYPEPSLRPMGDLDILVPVSNKNEALRVARTLGYGDAGPEASPGLNDLLSHHAGLRKTGPREIHLEIHTSLVADRSFRYAVPVDWFWTQLEPLETTRMKVDGLDLFMLTPSAQILYASAHAMLQHGGKISPLRWFYDLDWLVRSYEQRLDWDQLVSMARSFEWGSALSAALSRSAATFGTPVPEKVLASLEGISDGNLELVKLKQSQPVTHTLEERQKYLSLHGIARLRFFIALAFPGFTYMRWRYKFSSPWLLPVFYFRRWAGIMKDGVKTILVLMRG